MTTYKVHSSVGGVAVYPNGKTLESSTHGNIISTTDNVKQILNTNVTVRQNLVVEPTPKLDKISIPKIENISVGSLPAPSRPEPLKVQNSQKLETKAKEDPKTIQTPAKKSF